VQSSLALALPRIISRLIDRLERGNFAVQLEHQHLKSAANRLVVGLFVSSLLLGSSILLAQNVPPRVFGLSLFGMIGYVAAILYGLRVLWINRDRLVSRRHGDWE
jgi:ubiquinone biosynthesis protein